MWQPCDGYVCYFVLNTSQHKYTLFIFNFFALHREEDEEVEMKRNEKQEREKEREQKKITYRLGIFKCTHAFCHYANKQIQIE